MNIPSGIHQCLQIKLSCIIHTKDHYLPVISYGFERENIVSKGRDKLHNKSLKTDLKLFTMPTCSLYIR
jgi:hypothetical protein